MPDDAAAAMAAEAEIGECRRRLRALARTLEELEDRAAERLAAVFRARQRMDPAAAEAALRRADELLAAYAQSAETA